VILLYVIGGLVLAALSGLVAIGLLLGEEPDPGEVSDGYRREREWWVR